MGAAAHLAGAGAEGEEGSREVLPDSKRAHLSIYKSIHKMPSLVSFSPHQCLPTTFPGQNSATSPEAPLEATKDRKVSSPLPTQMAALSSSSAYNPESSPFSSTSKPQTGTALSTQRSTMLSSSQRPTGARPVDVRTTTPSPTRTTWSSMNGFNNSRTRSCLTSSSSCSGETSRVLPTSCPITSNSPSSESLSSVKQQASHTIPASEKPFS